MQMRFFRRRLLISSIAAMLFVLLAGCARSRHGNAAAARGDNMAGERPVVVVAVGDMACDPRSRFFNGGKGVPGHCQELATSNLAMAQHPDAVLTLGDNQYETGKLWAFERSYDPTWGRLKAITHPVPGNHEDYTPGAAGYYDYFGPLAGPRGKGWYSFDLGGWHLIALNSYCRAGRCFAGREQERWLRQDLAAHRGRCTLAYWHVPRFASGQFHGDHEVYTAFWKDLYDAGADLVLNGHDHNYERFAPQTPDGRPDPERGLREIIVGTGGKNLRGFMRGFPYHRNFNSEVRQATTFGVLRLELYPGRYKWRYVAENPEAFSDSGEGVCHSAQR